MLLKYLIGLLLVASVFLIGGSAKAADKVVLRLTLPLSIQVSGKVGDDCNVIGKIVVETNGQVTVDCKIRNSNRVRGFTGQLAVAFYDAEGRLIAQDSWNRGIDARNPLTGKTKSSSIGKTFTLSKSQLANFRTVKIIVRHNSSNRLFNEIEDAFKISKQDLKDAGDMVVQAVKDANVSDEDSSVREHLAKNDPWEKSKEEAYFLYRREQMRSVHKNYVMQLLPTQVGEARPLVNSEPTRSLLRPDANRESNQSLKPVIVLQPRLGITGASTPEGVRVLAVQGGVARSLGLEPGDIVTRIDKTQVYSPQDVIRALEEAIRDRGGSFTIVVRNVRYGREPGANEYVTSNGQLSADN